MISILTNKILHFFGLLLLISLSTAMNFLYKCEKIMFGRMEWHAVKQAGHAPLAQMLYIYFL